MERRLETQEIPVLSIDWLLEIIAVDFPTLFHIKKHLNSKSSQNRSLSQNFYRKIPTLNPSKISQKVSMKLSVKWNLSNYSSNKSTRGKKTTTKKPQLIEYKSFLGGTKDHLTQNLLRKEIKYNLSTWKRGRKKRRIS